MLGTAQRMLLTLHDDVFHYTPVRLPVDENELSVIHKLSPSERLGHSVWPELEHALLSCLEKARAKARDLSHMLSRCAPANDLNVDEAEAWWLHYERSEKSSCQILINDDDGNATLGATQDLSEDAE